MNQRNVDLLRGFFDAFNARDWEAFARALAPDVVWHNRDTGTIEGRENVITAISESEGVEWIDHVHDVLANDDHAVALVDSHVTAGEKSIRFKFVEVVHMRNGRITERWAFTSEPAAVAQFFENLA